MKHIILLILTLSLLGCQTPPADITPPAPTAEHTPVPTAAPTQTPTHEPIDDLKKYIDPSMKDTLRTAIGDAEFTELFASIGEKGEITGTDYGTGQKFEGTVVPESMVFKTTADWYFDTIVTAQAKDKDGKEFKVVWNKDENHWVRAERTHFKNIDQMVETGDYNLVLLTQLGYGEPFPEGTEKAQYMIGLAGSFGIEIEGKTVFDIILKLEAIRSDVDDFDFAETNLIKLNLREAGFHKGTAPQKTHNEDFGITTDGKEIVLIPIEIQNSNGKNIIIPAGLDPLLHGYFTDSTKTDDQGRTGFDLISAGERSRFTPAFPTDNPDDWNNFPKHDYGNGNSHIPAINNFDFMNNVIIELLEKNPDGIDEIFHSLPEDMQRKIQQSLVPAREGNLKVQSFFPFEGGAIPDEFAWALSRNITEAITTNGFLEPAK